MSANTWALFGFDKNDKPTRAQDLSYGGVLYEYYQGNSFDALSLLKVAQEKGGIKGHGDHPRLVEGGLLLSYGMTREAKSIFEELLKEKLTLKDQNLAWFYLGKVFFLEQHYNDAFTSFEHITDEVLKAIDAEVYYELVYIKSQIMSFHSKSLDERLRVKYSNNYTLGTLPVKHIYEYYIRYNEAVSKLNGTDNQVTINEFTALINDLSEDLTNGQWRNQKTRKANDRVDLALELKALYNQSLLSLGQIYLEKNNNEAAFNTLKRIDKESVFSDQALFAYAIAASNLQRYDLALSALNTLNKQTLFNPWQQQTPYALAYLYEQLKEPVLALEAYRAAVGQYENLQAALNKEKQELNEEVLLKALNIQNSIGSEALEKDAYGRIKLKKNNFSFSKLLTTETFQRQISELHELYLLKNSMQRWSTQLASFEDILATRLLSRQQKIQSTQTELATLEVDQWLLKEQVFDQEINQALNDENPYFFMTEEQISYHKRLQKAQERLSTLPDEHAKKMQYSQRFKRAKAYFDWWVSDDYAVNRWRTLKELRALKAQMALFRKQHELLDAQQEMDDTHLKFVARVNSGRERLTILSTSLDRSLQQSSAKLIELVDVAMQQQLDEIARYLLASREALARVSDALLVEGKIVYSKPAIQDDQKPTRQINLEGQE